MNDFLIFGALLTMLHCHEAALHKRQTFSYVNNLCQYF